LKEPGFSQEKINYSDNHLLEFCIVRKTSQEVNFSRFNIQDLNDIPILERSATQQQHWTEEYLESTYPSEALKKK
jgi:hypothetical protein